MLNQVPIFNKVFESQVYNCESDASKAYNLGPFH